MRAPTAAEQSVFGADCKIGPDDKPIEQGIGALSNPNKNSHEAAVARIKALEDASKRGASSDEIKKLLKELLRPPEDMTEEEKVQEAREAAEAEARELADKQKDQAIADLTARLAALEASAAKINQEPEKSLEF